MSQFRNGSGVVPRILVVDDEAHLRELLEITLIKMGLDVDSAATLASARQFFASNDYALILTDMRLPDGLGLELVSEVARSGKNTAIAVITAFGSADNAVVALKAGAFDYVSKPVALDQLRKLVHSALQVSSVNQSALQSASTPARLIGQSRAMQELRLQIARLSRSMAPVAICGESGSGKELAAREIHAQSARAGKPFVAVNCGAIPEALMEAEFFGYRKGAFTGANEERDGFFQAANGGTLMLDEVADLPLPMQVKLLRAIQERAVRKLGATNEESVDVRIISATHQNLEECVANKRFRQDLFYRLNVIELSLPPLRQRLDDIELLARFILKKLSPDPMILSAPALNALRSYSFPGNVRELENILERALAFANEGVVELADLALKPHRSAADATEFAVTGRRAENATEYSAEKATERSGVPADKAEGSDGAGQSVVLRGAAAAIVLPPEPLFLNSDAGMSTAAASAASAASAVTVVPALPLIGSVPESPPVQLQVPIPPFAHSPPLRQGDAVQDGAGQSAELPKNLPAYLEQVERDIIQRALYKTRYNKTQAAELLGISFRQLRYQIQKLKIDEDE